MKYAAYCGTRGIYDDMEIAAKSLIANSSVDEVHFIIEDAEFPRELPDIIKCHDMSGQTFFRPDGPNMKSGFTYMAMMRIALCHVLPKADMVLSLDADTVCVRNIDDVWQLPMENEYFASTPEWHRSSNGLQYCNFGVVLYNLKKMRDGKSDECIETLNRRRFTWVEQDVGSYLCQGHITEMPAEYNANNWTIKDFFNLPSQSRKSVARIVHYAGIKDYRGYDEWKEWQNVTWDEVMARHG